MPVNPFDLREGVFAGLNTEFMQTTVPPGLRLGDPGALTALRNRASSIREGILYGLKEAHTGVAAAQLSTSALGVFHRDLARMMLVLGRQEGAASLEALLDQFQVSGQLRTDILRAGRGSGDVDLLRQLFLEAPKGEDPEFWRGRVKSQLGPEAGVFIRPPTAVPPPPKAPPKPSQPSVTLKQVGSSVMEFMKRHRAKAVLGGVVAGIGYGAYALLGSRGDQSIHVGAGMLGQRGRILTDYLKDVPENLTPSGQARIKTGTAVHELIQQRMLETGEAAATEVEVFDPQLGVKGFIDVMLKGNIPLEIKTISGDDLRSITTPKPSHASQLNFYAHTVSAPFGVLRYASAGDPNDFIDFQIPYEPGRLIADIENLASQVMQLRGQLPKKIVQWAQARSTDRGIRNEHGFNSSFHTMGQGGDFARGRISSVSQLRKSLAGLGRPTTPSLPKPPDPFKNFYHGNRSKQRGPG